MQHMYTRESTWGREFAIFNIPVSVATFNQSEIALENVKALHLITVRIPARKVPINTLP